VLALIAEPGLAASQPSTPLTFRGSALWVTELAPTQTGRDIVAEAAEGAMHTVYVKAADGATADLQFSPELVGEMRAADATVCAWTFAYGAAPVSEAATAVAAVRAGAQCLVVDAEEQYDSRYGPAQAFVRALRAQLGAAFPIGLASQAEVAEHPKFPYSVFLGPGGFNVVLPLMYWRDFGVSVQAAYTATLAGNTIYDRPILPVGQLYGSPTTAELMRFRELARDYASPGLSFFDLASAAPEELVALAAPLPRPAHKAISGPTLRAGADGDDVVQAQELLNAAGAHLPVGGFFGAQTDHAVASFQTRYSLRASGVLDPATWRALLHFHPREPSWASAPPDSAQ
jgi:Putative peptidoglycan binding domain